MKRAFVALFAVLALNGRAAFAEPMFDQIQRGAYQAVLGDCAGCHTAPGGAAFAGGVSLETPFGKLVAPNITPDPETGIGAWTEADFRNTMKFGIGHNGKRLYPAMPYPAYSLMSGRDISDLWAYLRTLTPVKNEVVSNQLPFPFNIRLLMTGWNWLNFTPREFTRNPDKSPEWNRGAYIVQGPGHCATCHSPKTFLGADKSDGFLTGATLQNWMAPNVTADGHTGLGHWSVDDIVAYLKTGVNRTTIASGPMSEVITNSTSKMTDEDLRAIATYLKDLQSSTSDTPQSIAADDPAMVTGKTVYTDNCSACHGGKGEGQTKLFPKLANNSLVQQSDATTLVHILLAGSQGAGTPHAPTTPAMPSFGWRLNDAQVADVLTYIRNVWGNAGPAVQKDTVTGLRAKLQESPQ